MATDSFRTLSTVNELFGLREINFLSLVLTYEITNKCGVPLSVKGRRGRGGEEPLKV